MSFWIVTDACCDLPASYVRQQTNFRVAPMSYQIEGNVEEIDLTDEKLPQKTHEFYQKLIDGAVATTFQVNQQGWTEQVESLCREGNDVLIPVFSSGLSGTYLAAKAAAEKLSAKYPERKIFAVDSLCASLGQGLFVHYLLRYRDEGHSIEETRDWAKQNALRFIHWFTVTDLHFLSRGGRLSGASAHFGTILKIKPVLNVDPKGHLIPREKVQGRKHSLRALFEKVAEEAPDPAHQPIFISHGDCPEDAQWLADKLKEELHVSDITISTIGPIIGSHSGPGTVAVFYVDRDGSHRLNVVEKD